MRDQGVQGGLSYPAVAVEEILDRVSEQQRRLAEIRADLESLVLGLGEVLCHDSQPRLRDTAHETMNRK